MCMSISLIKAHCFHNNTNWARMQSHSRVAWQTSWIVLAFIILLIYCSHKICYTFAQIVIHVNAIWTTSEPNWTVQSIQIIQSLSRFDYLCLCHVCMLPCVRVPLHESLVSTLPHRIRGHFSLVRYRLFRSTTTTATKPPTISTTNNSTTYQTKPNTSSRCHHGVHHGVPTQFTY